MAVDEDAVPGLPQLGFEEAQHVLVRLRPALVKQRDVQLLRAGRASHASRRINHRGHRGRRGIADCGIRIVDLGFEI
jgi:hypothetical protein